MAKMISRLVLGWLFLASIFSLIQSAHIPFDAPAIFPISIVDLGFHSTGLIFAFIFLAIVYLALKYISHLKLIHIWILAVVLIIFGNLAQGNLEKAFTNPITDKGLGYYYDAIKITSAREWLSTFNEKQTELGIHARDHPPFAVLLHFEIMAVGNNQPGYLSAVFIFIASLSIWLLWLIFKLLDVPQPRRTLLMVLFSVIPAFNIYGGVSLEAIILTTSLLYLYGLLWILKHGFRLFGIIFFLAGIFLTNALTFAGTFLLAATLFIAIWQAWLKRKRGVLILLGATILLGIGSWIFIKIIFGYDHLQSFLVASRLENPNGFYAFADPLSYVLTRIEGLSEIALFLSFGSLSLFLMPKILNWNFKDNRDDTNIIFFAGISSLLLMFLVGSFSTGETARICLFIYPYIFLLFRNIAKEDVIGSLVLITASQTIFMQIFGYYIW